MNSHAAFVLVALPPERAAVAARVLAGGGTPLIDLEQGDGPIPAGAWVRARPGEPPGGEGPVVVAPGEAPIPGRPTWLTVLAPQALPEGFAGLLLRGSAAGGRCGETRALSALAAFPAGTPVIVEDGLLPEEIDALRAAGAVGVVLFEAVLGLPELGLPPRVARQLAQADRARFVQAGGCNVFASPLGPGLGRLLAGQSDVWRGWIQADDPAHTPVPAGPSAAEAAAVARRYGTLAALLAAAGARVQAPPPAPAAEVVQATAPPTRRQGVAIIGLGARLPGANSVAELWENLLAGRSAITEVPASRWDWRLFYDADHAVPDKTYSKIGGFLTSFQFNPRRFRIPPSVVASIDPVQQIALEAVAEALEDAGLKVEAKGPGRDFDRQRTAVILGNSMGGEVTDDYAIRVRLPALQRALSAVPGFAALPEADRAEILGRFEEAVKAELPVITEDSMPGELSNVIAGRVANAFDLAGANFTVDAACASSMAAVQTAVKGLLDHDFDLAITGGADRSMGAPTYAKFCKIGALSARHSAPFDAEADGFVMGEGCGVLICKRLEDALRDGDRIYAVISGVGASSDGKGKGITAPNPAGQQLALRRAWAAAGADPAEADLIECHGTSTFVGDKVEVESLNAVIGGGKRSSGRGPIRIGSVKSNIGHLKSAAGAASLIKTSLALHHKVFPPSINFKKPRPDVPYDVVPLKVQTAAEPWPGGRRRRAGVSAFGFGGTNFHLVLEEAPAPGTLVEEAPLREPAPALPPAPRAGHRLPAPLWGVSAETRDELIALLGRPEDPDRPFEADAPVRLVAAAATPEERAEQRERAHSTLKKGGSAPELLRSRGIAFEDEPCNRQLAFLFTGQGSQYVGMGMDLAERFPVVAATFAEADAVLAEELGRPLSSYLRPDPTMDPAAQELALRATEIAQPATLTMDVSLLRLMNAYGVSPDRLAGHSLGEYAAAVAAGVLSFPDALKAVCARGREMAAVKIDDKGLMASIPASPDAVGEVLNQVDGYVVAANKNCPTQTVIAGATAAVEEAIQRFTAAGLTVTRLPVSHAFHSSIVAPASAPLRKVLERLDVRPPRKPLTTNVTGGYYPDTREEILDLLAKQVAAPVEWVTQLGRLREDGATIYVECGPKRALTGFVTATLKRLPHRAIATNHPRRGGVMSFFEALAALAALGFPVRAEPGQVDLFAPMAPRRATDAAQAARRAPPALPRVAPMPAPSASSGSPAQASTAEAFAQALAAGARQGGASGPVADRIAAAVLPAVSSLIASVVAAMGPVAPVEVVQAAPPPITVVASGASLGLPGGEEVFGEDNVRRILAGENRISRLPDAMLDAFLAKNVVRLRKDAATGQGSFEAVQSREEVIRLAGVGAHFDLGADYGIEAEWLRALDITTRLAFAAGIEALRDAGIPLVRTFKETTSGKKVALGWALPEAMRSRTGVIFACAFPGYTNLLNHVAKDGDDGEGRFDRRFLFQILSMGHSQFAQLIGARGPNTQVNAACASTTQALCIAQDWITAGRADAVVVIGADDVTNDTMLPWIGAGFLASGAATTKDEVSEAALPFDRRRHGMILGMGAVGVVLERAEQVAARGMAPLARLLASRLGNSAFHGTRLDALHIAVEMDQLVGEATAAAGVSRADFARQAVFMSHETYTPARGGSAAAEIESLRTAFGPAANQILVANTKGFTGHAMGAGIEDAVVLKALQHRTVPPVPNLREPDPDLGDLRLSPGGVFPHLRYALRLSAGFGSQLALTAWEGLVEGEARVVDAGRHTAWLQQISGSSAPRLVVEHRTLRLLAEGGAPAVVEPTAPAPAPAAPPAAAGVGRDEVLRVLLGILSKKTGYAVAELDPTYELEADLGVDTVKQAEVFGEVREHFSLPRDDSFRLADHPSINGLVDWLFGRITAQGGGAPAPSAAPAPAPAPSARVGRDEVLGVLLGILSKKTGYAVAELDPAYELEADLGVDTVKQAEVFGEVREHFKLPRDDSFRLADHPSINGLVDWLHGRIVGVEEAARPAAPLPVEAAPAPAPAPPPPVASDRRDEVLAVFLDILARRTGYAKDELDPAYELEADLGVDTVKQAELFGEVREHFKLPRDDRFSLADYPTINSLVDWLASKVAAQESPAAPAEAPVAPPPAVEAPSVEAAPTAPPPPVEPPRAPEDLFTAEGGPADPRGLPAAFRLRRPTLVARSLARGRPRLNGTVVMVAGEGAFATALRLEALDRGATLEGSSPDVVLDCSNEVYTSFQLARTLDARRPRHWIAATRLGSDASWIEPEIGLAHGARAGLAKALGREWVGTYARLVDTDPMLTDAVAARLVLDEVVAGDGAVEIFHDGEQRRILTLRLEEMPPAEGRLREGSIIVVTGGTRGITAQVAIELARRGPVRLALLARTLPGSTPLDEEAAKATIRAELEAAGERATPARIDQRLRPLRVAEEGRLTVAALRELGAEVRTFVVDMADEESVREYLHRVRDEWGRIDGVIHGAGVEESRLLSDKDLDAFRRVFDGKARGGMAIARNLERGAWFLSMGSVAGRFGNAGQVDYAAANEGLARVALSRPRSLHVDWTAWADAGMAVRGGMERLLTEKGVELLPALAGARLTVDLLAAGVTGEVLVAGRLGDFSMPALHPLVDRIELLGDLVLGRRSLSLASDPWLADHAIDGVPVLPGVIGLELLAATAAHLRPGEAYVGARAVSFRAPVKVHRDEPVALTMAARLIEGGEVAVRLSSERVAKTGRPLLTHHFEAILRFGEPVAVDALPSAFLPEEPIDRAAIYRRFFHGPGFQVLSECGAVASNGLMAEAVVSHDALGGAAAMLTAPLLLEAAFQAAGLHHMAVHGALALPAGIEALVLESRPADGEPLGLMVSERADGRYDIDLDGPSGIALRVRGFSMAVLGPLPPADRFTPPRGGWPQAVVSRARPVGKKSGGAQALHPAEQALIAARGRPERQAERVLGRLAAQQALIGLLGEAPPVLNAEGGAPFVVDHPELVVSISHSAGDAFAAVATSGRLGLDLEQVVLRHPSFARTWFTDAEQALADEDCARTTAIWAVKEAVLKALGAGMRLSPNEIEVTALRGRRAWVSLQGRAAALHAAQGGGPVVATLTVLDTAILATVYLRGAAGPLPALARCA